MSTGYSGDVAERATVDFDFDEIDRRLAASNPCENCPHQEQQPRETDRDEVRTALIQFAVILLDSDDYRLKLDVAVEALGFNFYQGKSFTRLAEKHKITKQAFSKRVRKFQDEFGLPPTRSQKSVASRQKYREAQLKRYGHHQEKKDTGTG